MTATLSHPPGTNLVNDPAALDDTAVAVELPEGLRRTVVVRLVLLVVGCAIAFWPAWRPLIDNLGADTPIAYSATAPLIAAALLGVAVRTAPAGSPRIARRQADRAGALIVAVIAVVIALWLPGRFGFLSNELRAELMALPVAALAGCLLLFGSRTTFYVRPSIYVLALASPLGYSWLLDASTDLAWKVTWRSTEVGAWLMGIETTNLAGTGLVGVGDGNLMAVSAVCSGIASVAGWLIVSTAFAGLCVGRVRPKLLFVLTGLAACLAGNAVRVLFLVVAARWWGLDVAYELIHPYAGFVVLAVVVAVMMALAPRFGLRRRRTVAPSAIERVALSAPLHVGRDLFAWGAVVAVLFLATSQTWRFDQLAGQNGERNLSAATVLAVAADDEDALDGWRVHALPVVPWADQFFGPGAEWTRSLVVPGGIAGDAPTLTVDVTAVEQSVHLDRYTLAACYGFHGYELERVNVSTAIPDRPAERIVYVDEDADVSTVVMSFRQRTLDGRVERVVVSARVPVGEEDPAHDAVLALARDLAAASASGGDQ